MSTPTNENTTINLQNDITVNGKTYRAGSGVHVPKAQADDILRMDHDHTTYKLNLQKKRTSEVNAGQFSVGGGAE